MGAVLQRLQDLPEYAVNGQMNLPTAPVASATKAVMLLGAALSGGSASGTYFGVNAAAGYAGDLVNYQVNGATVYRVLSSGFVALGLGSAAPSAAVHISSSGSGFIVDRVAENANSPILQTRKARGALGAETACVLDDAGGSIIASFHDGTSYRNVGLSRWLVAGTVSLANVPTKWELYTTQTTANVLRLTADKDGNIIQGTGALATGATDGFLYIPSCPGVPSGTPTAYTGRAALVWDSVNKDLYGNDGSGWNKVA